MATPRIALFHEVCHREDLALSSFPSSEVSEDDELFVVLSAGHFNGVWWSKGDVVVCGGTADAGNATVLVPHGHGWPRLGNVSAYGRLSGDAGEPCSIDRWNVCGTVRAVYRCVGTRQMERGVLGRGSASPRCTWVLAFGASELSVASQQSKERQALFIQDQPTVELVGWHRPAVVNSSSNGDGSETQLSLFSTRTAHAA